VPTECALYCVENGLGVGRREADEVIMVSGRKGFPAGRGRIRKDGIYMVDEFRRLGLEQHARILEMASREAGECRGSIHGRNCN
jgi:hypothetical protein